MTMPKLKLSRQKAAGFPIGMRPKTIQLNGLCENQAVDYLAKKTVKRPRRCCRLQILQRNEIALLTNRDAYCIGNVRVSNVGCRHCSFAESEGIVLSDVAWWSSQKDSTGLNS